MANAPPAHDGQDIACRSDSGTLGLFLLLTCMFSALFWVLRAEGHASAYYTVGLMWSPAAAAGLTLWLRRDRFATLGLSRLGGRYAAIGYGLPFAYCLVAYGFIWLGGIGGFPDAAAMAKIQAGLGWQIANPAVFIGLYVLLVATTGLIPDIARALGEEIGWRGFLAPRLTARFGFPGGSLVGGVIWTAWHVPLILFASYHSDAPRWFALTCFTVMVVGLTFVLTWLRQRSGSVWPCALLHACHNVLIQSVFSPLTASRGRITAYAVDEFGFALPAVILVIVLVLVQRRYRNRPKRPEGDAS